MHTPNDYRVSQKQTVHKVSSIAENGNIISQEQNKIVYLQSKIFCNISFTK